MGVLTMQGVPLARQVTRKLLAPQCTQYWLPDTALHSAAAATGAVVHGVAGQGPQWKRQQSWHGKQGWGW